MSKNRNLTYWIIILPILAILLTSSILTYEFISYENKEFEYESQELEKNYIEELKERISNRVNRVSKLIATDIKITTEDEKHSIKNFINIGYKTIEETYLSNKNLSKNEIIQKIKQRLENIRFYDNGSGYYFLIGLDNKTIMNPQTPQHEGKDFSYLKDAQGNYFIQEFKKIVINHKEGYADWYWTKPKREGTFKKIGYIKLFEPLDLYIGTAKYKEDIDKKIEKEILKLISIIKYSENEYIFAINEKGTTLSHINSNFIGKKLLENSQIEQDIIKNILKSSQNQEGGFIEYTPTSHNLKDTISKKISYVKKIETLNWTIGTGQYTTKLKNQIKLKKDELKEELKEATQTIVIISVVISLILILILTYLANNLQKRFLVYENELKKKNNKLKILNINLEKEVKKQVFDIRKKDEILNQQSKLAAMGEMIGNIAHQWRQPLSTISTAASGIKMQDEMGILKKDIMYYSLDTIVHNTKVLSHTIEDFRNFFKKDKKRVHFDIETTLQKVFNLISSSLKDQEIHVIREPKSCKLYGLENELTQALLNIFTNAKDALEELKKEEDKFIFVGIDSNEEQISIKIKDNAGGIKEEILGKVFEPYFTTKFKNQGTGIGLYMTQTIIVKHMKGSIQVKNIEFEYQNKKYIGAEFEVILYKK